MQYGHALDCVLHEILLTDPALDLVHLLKIDIRDGFYRIALNVDDIPKLGVVFPTTPGAEPLIAFPLVLPMGWTYSPPIFTTTMGTIVDLANHRFTTVANPPPHHLDALAQFITPILPAPPTDMSHLIPIARDPSLSATVTPLAYADVFVDDFVGAAQQGPHAMLQMDSTSHL